MSQNVQGVNAVSQKMTGEQRGTKMIITIMASFVILWGPYMVVGVMKVAGNPNLLLNTLLGAFAILGFFNAATNFVIYGAMNSNFYQAYRRILGIGKNKVGNEQTAGTR